MINEFIIVLTDSRAKQLVKLAEKSGYEDDLLFLQEMINELTDSKELAEMLGELLAKEMSDEARLTHTEK